MNFINVDPGTLLDDLDAQRQRMNMSYQDVADACNVSKATISRVFNRATDPQISLLQKIAAAVEYSPAVEPVVLTGYTQDAYVEFLKRTIAAEKEEHHLREAQAEARHNMLMNQKNRTIAYLSGILFLFALGFISWLIIDVTHPTVGWFQREMSYHSNAAATAWNHLRAYIENLFI